MGCSSSVNQIRTEPEKKGNEKDSKTIKPSSIKVLVEDNRPIAGTNNLRVQPALPPVLRVEKEKKGRNSETPVPENKENAEKKEAPLNNQSQVMANDGANLLAESQVPFVQNPGYDKSKPMVVKKYEDGGVYNGQLVEDERHGYGEYKFPDGGVYKGMWDQGQRTGYGEFNWKDGMYYKGFWKGNSMEGKGEYLWPGVARYRGDWVKHRMDGKGECQWAGGDKYVGEYMFHQKCGVGEMKWADGSSYKGDWTDDMMNGKGVLIRADGTKEEGNWKYDERAPNKPANNANKPGPNNTNKNVPNANIANKNGPVVGNKGDANAGAKPGPNTEKKPENKPKNDAPAIPKPWQKQPQA